jgi:hypothetical protein
MFSALRATDRWASPNMTEREHGAAYRRRRYEFDFRGALQALDGNKNLGLALLISL